MNNYKLVSKIVATSEAYPDETFSRKGKAYTCINPYYYQMLRKNLDLYNKLDGVFVDGMTMCWMIRLLWGKKVERRSFDMSGMAADLFSKLNDKDNSESIFFIGAKHEDVVKTVHQICLSYPNMKINGMRNGFLASGLEKDLAIENIIRRNPDYVAIGMGSPLQEEFAVSLRDAGYNGIVFTCGGFLHQTVNRINYYPAWVDKLNLRAFYRLFHEKGMWKRLYNILIEFPITFTIDSLRSKRALRKAQRAGGSGRLPAQE